MRTAVAAVVVAGLVVALGQVVNAGGSGKAFLEVKSKEGPTLTVPPFEIKKQKVKCPKNFAAVGVGVLPGATDIVYADIDPNERYAEFAFGNPDPDSSFHASGEVECVAGAGSLHIESASLRRSAEQAIGEWRERVRP